jgi:hypothetical protein
VEVTKIGGGLDQTIGKERRRMGEKQRDWRRSIKLLEKEKGALEEEK